MVDLKENGAKREVKLLGFKMNPKPIPTEWLNFIIGLYGIGLIILTLFAIFLLFYLFWS